jgi:hypothetical protein
VVIDLGMGRDLEPMGLKEAPIGRAGLESPKAEHRPPVQSDDACRY